MVSDSSTLPTVRKFTVTGLLLLLIIYESFAMSGSPFKIVTFGDPLAVQIFLMIFFIYYEHLLCFCLNIFRTFHVCVLNLILFIITLIPAVKWWITYAFVSVFVPAVYILTGSNFASCFCKVRRIFLQVLWRMWKIIDWYSTQYHQPVWCKFILFLGLWNELYNVVT